MTVYIDENTESLLHAMSVMITPHKTTSPSTTPASAKETSPLSPLRSLREGVLVTTRTNRFTVSYIEHKARRTSDAGTGWRTEHRTQPIFFMELPFMDLTLLDGSISLMIVIIRLCATATQNHQRGES